MIIAAHVITAEPETVFLIDEPEKNTSIGLLASHF